MSPEDVIAAAGAVAIESGLSGVSREAVAAWCRVPARAIEAVQSDERLVAAAFEQISRAELAALKRRLLSAPSPVNQLWLLLQTLAEPAGLELDRVWTEVWSLGHSNPTLRDTAVELETAWHTLVAGIVRRGIRTGDFFAVDADVVAAQILVMSAGISAYSLVDYQKDIDPMRLLALIVRAELGVEFDEADRSAETT